MPRWVLLLVLPLVSGCLREEPGPEGLPDGTIRMGGNVGDQFTPAFAAVPQGARVTFDHLGGESIHNVRSETGAWVHRDPDLADFVLDTSSLPPGDYPYFCEAHLGVGMRGTLRVLARGL